MGAPISVGFDPIHSRDDLASHVRRHGLAELRHIAILPRGQIPAYADARITSVVEAKTKHDAAASSATTSIGWRAPVGWECLTKNGYQPTEGDELLKGRTATHRFTGGRFVALP